MDSNNYTKFTEEVEELFKKYFDGKEEYVLAVAEHLDDDTLGDFGLSGQGCPACMTMVLTAMVKTGQIKHFDEEEKIH